MRVAVGPFLPYRTDAGETGWRGPEAALGVIDLRDGTRNVGVFAVPDNFSDGGYLLLGGPDDTISTSQRNSLRALTGLTRLISADRVLPAVAEVATEHADPVNGRNPVIPTHEGMLEVHLGPARFVRPFMGKAEGPVWERVRVVMRREYVEIKQRNPALAAKWGEAMRRKLSVDFHDIADPGDRPHDPTTTYTETFNKADSTTLGPNLTWAETTGDLAVSSNQCRANATATYSEARAEHDLSSSDHHVTITVPNKVAVNTATNDSRALARFSASARTHYIALLLTSIAQAAGAMQLGKRNAGTFTSLRTDAVAWAAGDTVMVHCSGSTISMWRNGVQQGASVTDTDIPGNTRFGVANQRQDATMVLDSLVAEDLLSTVVIFRGGMVGAFGNPTGGFTNG